MALNVYGNLIRHISVRAFSVAGACLKNMSEGNESSMSSMSSPTTGFDLGCLAQALHMFQRACIIPFIELTP